MEMEIVNGNSLSGYIINLSRSLHSAIGSTSANATYPMVPQINQGTPQIVVNGVDIETRASTKWDITAKDLRSDIAQLKQSHTFHTGQLVHTFEVCLQVVIWLKVLAEETENGRRNSDKVSMIQGWLQNVELVAVLGGSQVLDWKRGMGRYEEDNHMADLATMAMGRLQIRG